MKRNLAVFFVCFIVSAVLAFPQGSFLKPGQSGLGVSGALATNRDVSGFSGMASVALAGVFDLSISMGRATYDAATFGDLKARALAGEIRAYVVRQGTAKSPVTVSISVGFAGDKFTSPDFEPDNLTMRSHSFSIGGTVHRDFPLVKKAFLQPYVGVVYANTTTKVSDPTGLTLSSTEGLPALIVGVPLVYSLSARAMAVLQPGVALDKNNVTFAVSLGLVVALTKAK